MTQPSIEDRGHSLKGLLVSLLVIPVGVALWVILWSWGFIASIVSFGIAWGAIWLYRAGSGRSWPTTRDAWLLFAVILIGVILAFLGGIVSDIWLGYSEVYGSEAVLLSGDFFSVTAEVLSDPEVWSEYTTDIIISLAFAILGAGALVRGMFSKPAPEEAPEASSDEEK